MVRRTHVCAGLLLLVLASLGMGGAAVERYPAFWLQPAARTYVAEAAGVLLVYAAAIVWVALRRGVWWDAAVRAAALFGAISGCMEALNIASENGLLPAIHGPLILAVMLAVFVGWGLAGWHGARLLGSVRGGVATAALSAGVCMVIGVAAGFAVEFFVAPPAPASVATWGEYLRSGWTDARAFAIANTLDSGWTHLLLGPFVAVVFGGLGALAGRWRGRCSAAVA